MVQALSLPDHVEFTCPYCHRPVRFVIGIREGVPSDQPGGLDYFPTCPHCGTEVRITVFPASRPWPSSTSAVGLAGTVFLLLAWLFFRRRGPRG